jgi:hypothetical protein
MIHHNSQRREQQQRRHYCYCRHRHRHRHRRRQQQQMKSYFWVCCASSACCYLLITLLVQGVSCRVITTTTTTTTAAARKTGNSIINASNGNNNNVDIINHRDAVLTQNSTESSNSNIIPLDTELLEYFSRSDNENENEEEDDGEEDDDKDDNDHGEEDNEQSLSSFSSVITSMLSSLGGGFNFNNFIRKKDDNNHHHHDSYDNHDDTASATRSINVVDDDDLYSRSYYTSDNNNINNNSNNPPTSRILGDGDDNDYYDMLHDREDDDGCTQDDDCDYPSSMKNNNVKLIVSESPTASDTSWWDASIKDLEDLPNNNDSTTDITSTGINAEISASVSGDFEKNGSASESESVDDDDEILAAIQQQPTPAPWNPDATKNSPRNSIMIRLHMGIVHSEQLTDEESNMITLMCLRALTSCFNELNIPFLMTDEYAFSVAEKEREASNRERQRELQDNDRYGDNAFIKSEEQRLRQERNDDDEDTDDNIIVNGSNNDMVGTSMDNKEDSHIAKLVLYNSTFAESNPNPGNSWWELQAIYTVWRHPRQRGGNQRQLPQPNPVMNRNILNKIQRMCGKAIGADIDNKQYWNMITSIEFGDQNLVLSPPYYLDDKGLADCKVSGDQYDLSPLYCQSFKPTTTTGEGKMKDDDTNTCVMEDPNIPTPLPLIDNDDCPDCDFPSPSNATFPEVIADSPLQVDWGIRELVGFGLMVTTIVFVVSLSSIAHIISKRRTAKRLWGAAMTQEGIDAILQVGWRYHEQKEQQQQEELVEGENKNDMQQQELLHQQLFLQIYDKGIGPGYNEENSVLKGGVERIDDINYYPPNAPPPVSTTAPTTSTPPPPPPPPSNNSNCIPPPEPFRPQCPD